MPFKDKEKEKEWRKKWRENNKDYYEKWKDNNPEYHRNWRKKNRRKCKKYSERCFRSTIRTHYNLPESEWWRLTGRESVRLRVRFRDNFTCQTCGKVWKPGQRHFDVHHLGGMCGKKSKGYDKVSDIDNLITLCHKCHFNHPEHSNNQ